MNSFTLITKPKIPTEFEMQAELYFHLKRMGLDVRGEVAASHDSERSFFDLVVFRGEYGAVIIEVKNGKALAFLNGKKTRQRVKYSKYGLPIVIYSTQTPLMEVVAKIKKIMDEL